MADFKNLNEYITSDLKVGIQDAIELSLKNVTKAQSSKDLISIKTSKTGISKILKQGFTP